MKYGITWDGYIGRVSLGESKGTLSAKPQIPNVTFDTLYFEPADGNFFKTIQGFNYQLTTEEGEAIQSFLKRMALPPQSFHMVDVNGNYLGFLPEASGRLKVGFAPPNGDYWKWNFSKAEWYMPFGANAEGFWVGNSRDVVFETQRPPQDGFYKYVPETGEWVETPESIKMKAVASLKDKLYVIDQRKVRAITDALLSGDTTQLQALESEAATYRSELKELLNDTTN